VLAAGMKPQNLSALPTSRQAAGRELAPELVYSELVESVEGDTTPLRAG